MTSTPRNSMKKTSNGTENRSNFFYETTEWFHKMLFLSTLSGATFSIFNQARSSLFPLEVCTVRLGNCKRLVRVSVLNM